LGLLTGGELLDGRSCGLTGGELEANLGNVLQTAPTSLRVQPELHGNIGRRQQGELLWRVVVGHATIMRMGV
jgi:hypothetical protein